MNILKNNLKFNCFQFFLIMAGITILITVIILAINPNRQKADIRNAQRKIDVNNILNAVYQQGVNNNGYIEPNIMISSESCWESSPKTEICKTGGNCKDLTNLSSLTINDQYLTTLPMDPNNTNPNGTGYKIIKNINEKISVCSIYSERGIIIYSAR